MLLDKLTIFDWSLFYIRKMINLPRKTDFPFSNYKTKRCVIFIHWFTLILVVDTRSVERTVDRVRIYKFVTHSDVNKSICQRQSNWYRLLSTFRSKCRDVELEFAFSSTNTRLSKHVVVSCGDAECEQALTPRDIYSSILQAHSGFINSEHFTNESCVRNFNGTHEGTYEHTY